MVLNEDKEVLLKLKRFCFNNDLKGFKDMMACFPADFDINKKLQSNTLLGWAFHFGHEGIMSHLLAIEGVDVNIKDSNETTLFMKSYLRGHRKVNELLIKIPEADINSWSRTCKYTPLMMACVNDDIEMVRLLVSRADLDPNMSFDVTEPAIMLAIEKDNVEILAALLQRPDLDVNGPFGINTPLSRAVIRDRYDMFSLLINRGDIRPNLYSTMNFPPIIFALHKKDPRFFMDLINHKKIDVNTRDSMGDTLLLRTLYTPQKQFWRPLLENEKVDVNVRNKDGYTPLFYASNLLSQHPDILWSLLQRPELLIEYNSERSALPVINSQSFEMIMASMHYIQIIGTPKFKKLYPEIQDPHRFHVELRIKLGYALEDAAKLVVIMRYVFFLRRYRVKVEGDNHITPNKMKIPHG